MKLPLFSNLFEDATGAVAAFARDEAHKVTKIKRDEFGAITEETTSIVSKKMAKTELPTFFDDMKKKVLSAKEKEQAKAKYDAMSQSEKEKYEEKLLKKQWGNVVRGVIRIYRFTQKFKMTVEQECKKFAILCAKEVKKKAAKSHRASKDYVFRAKRMHREMVIYWRKREKELAELKKKKEKLEAEIRKREDEERETLLQKKRLEFLMKQSDIYAHFMAQKLGMHDKDEGADGVKEGAIVEENNEISKDKGPSAFFKDEKIEIDEEAAFASIQGLINDQRANLKEFDLEAQKTRMDQGGP